MVWLPIGVVFDDVKHRWGHSSLTYRLTDQIKVVAFLSSDNCVDNSSGNWIIELFFANSLEESGVNAFGDDNEGQFNSLSGGSDICDRFFNLFQLIVVNVIYLSLRH